MNSDATAKLLMKLGKMAMVLLITNQSRAGAAALANHAGQPLADHGRSRLTQGGGRHARVSLPPVPTLIMILGPRRAGK